MIIQLIVSVIIFIVMFLITFLLFKYLDELEEKNKQKKIKKQILKLYETNDEESLRSTKKLIQNYIIKYPSDKEINDLYDDLIQKLIEIKIKNKNKYIGELNIINSKFNYLYSKLNEISDQKKSASYIVEKTNNNLPDEETYKLITEGINLYYKKNYEEAIDKLLNACLSSKKTSPVVNAYLGASYFYQNPENPDNIKKASIRCKKVLIEDITIDIAHFILAKIYLLKNINEKAIFEFENTLTINPAYYQASFELAKIYYKNNDYEKSENYFSKTIKEKPDHLESIFYPGELKMKKEQYKEAILFFEKLHGLNTNNLEVILNLAQIYIILEDFENAFSYYEKAIKLDKRFDIYYYLAECYEITNDKNKALINYKESINTNNSKTQKEIEFELKAYKRLIIIYEYKNNNIEIYNIIKKLENKNKFPDFIQTIKNKYGFEKLN